MGYHGFFWFDVTFFGAIFGPKAKGRTSEGLGDCELYLVVELYLSVVVETQGGGAVVFLHSPNGRPEINISMPLGVGEGSGLTTKPLSDPRDVDAMFQRGLCQLGGFEGAGMV